MSRVRHAHYRGLLIQGRVCKGNNTDPTKSTLRKAIQWDHPLYNITEGDRVTTIAEIAAARRRLRRHLGLGTEFECRADLAEELTLTVTLSPVTDMGIRVWEQSECALTP